MPSPAAPKLPPSYFQLIQQLPLTHLRTQRQFAAAQAMLDELLQQRLDRGGQEYLDALTDLIAAYEQEHCPMSDVSEADVLRELMTAAGLTQPGLAKLVGMAQSTISAVLHGSRSLTKEQILALAKHFGVSPAAFLPAR